MRLFKKIQAWIFDWEARRKGSRPEEVMRALGIKLGQSVADLGSGGGYFVRRFAEAVGDTGLVYAVDVDEDMLEIVREKAGQAGISNIKFVKAGEEQSNLPADCADLIFSRSSYHHLPEQVEYFKNLAPALKPGGRAAVIDYKPRKGIFGIFGNAHSTDAEKLKEDMASAGYVLAQEHKFLPRQLFMIFVRKSDA